MKPDDITQGTGPLPASAATAMCCPSCGRTIEASEVCPYCCTLTDPTRRVTEKSLVRWAVLVALLGIGLLAWSAFVETPVTPVANLENTGAFLHFRIQGKVTKTSYFKARYRDADVFSFWIDDGSQNESSGQTGTVKVKIDGPVYKRLQDDGSVPREGDSVDVEGTLYAGDGFRMLSVNTPEMLRIAPGGGK